MLMRGATLLAVVALGSAEAATPPAKRAAAPKAAIPAIPASGTLSRLHLVQIMLVGLKHKPSQFTSDPTIKFIGRNFAASFALVEPDKDGANWRYDLIDRALTFGTQGREWQVYYHQTPSGSYTATNAYGARVQVRKYLTTEAVFRPTMQPEESYSHGLIIGPAEAQALTKSARIVLEGGLEQSGSGAVDCEDISREPTISDPVEEFVSRCVFRGIVTTVSLVDSANAKVLKRWELKAPVR